MPKERTAATTADPALLVDAIRDHRCAVAVIGQGYVGLPVAMRAAALGFDVVGVDTSEQRVASLVGGRSYVEDITDGELAAALAGHYRATTDTDELAGFDVAVITVPTPLQSGAPDLSFVEAAARSLGAHLRRGAAVFLESTTYPGTTTELVAPILEEESSLVAGRDFFLGYSPERIDPGNREWSLYNTPKIVAGMDEASSRVIEAFYGELVAKVVPVGSPAEAELVKLLENTFRHVNIALVNELAMFARDLGVDIWSAIDAASTKPYGFMRFTPGPGVGGHCLPIDPSYLSWRVKQQLGEVFRFVELANDVNSHMPSYVLRRITTLLNDRERPVRGARILVLGSAYKAGTSDTRESPAMHVVAKLRDGGAHVSICDPHVAEIERDRIGLPFVELTPEHLAAADLVVVLVDHPEFAPDVIGEHASLVFDTKGIMRGSRFCGELL